jgi:hypothetical protein
LNDDSINFGNHFDEKVVTCDGESSLDGNTSQDASFHDITQVFLALEGESVPQVDLTVHRECVDPLLVAVGVGDQGGVSTHAVLHYL